MIEDGVRLTPLGRIAEAELSRTQDMRPGVECHDFVIMPNHLHVILEVFLAGAQAGEGTRSDFVRPRRLLGQVVGGYKGAVTARARRELGARVVWQSNYYDRVIRNEVELQALQRYIADNPLAWATDPNHPSASTR